MKKNLTKMLIAAIILCCFATSNAQKNVLLIMADDFNHWLPGIGYYPDAKTPNINKLAKQGILFSRAYAPSPVCNPSRNAMMSGLRPSTTNITNNKDGFIRNHPKFKNWVTMNQYFTQNGYYTYAGGKIYHMTTMNHNQSDKKNWSGIYPGVVGGKSGSAYAWSVPKCGSDIKWSGSKNGINNGGGDSELAKHMVNKIKNYNQSKPFFIACGFYRPHLPWHCPKEFFDMYNPSQLTVPPPGYKNKGAATCEHQQITKNKKWADAIRAYLANMSYADHNVGLLLDALKESGKANNTIVLFMGDHGWHLGEKNRWRKAMPWEHSNHTTLIIYDPSAKGNGQMSKKVVSLQDIYPTLVELCGLPHNHKVEGNSLKPLLNSPNLSSWDNPVLSKKDNTEWIRTEQWKFVDNGNKSQLYNAKTDINEHNNLYGKAGYQDVVKELRRKIDSLKKIGQNIVNGGGNCPNGPGNINDLTAVETNCTTATLSWTRDKCATEYLVRRKKGLNGQFINLGNVTYNSFTDNTLELNSKYEYEVKPIKGNIKKTSNPAYINTPASCGSTCPTPGSTTISKKDASCGYSDGEITFTFIDDPNHSSIEFSIDGGNSYTTAQDNWGSYTFYNLSEGTYNCHVRWAKNNCPTDLGFIAINCTGGGGNITIEDGTYFLQARHSMSYVTVKKASKKNGANICQWQNQNANHQKWNINKVNGDWYKVINVKSKKAMEVHTKNKKNPNNVRQSTYKELDRQLWKFVEIEDGWYQVECKQTNKVLTVAGGVSATKNGANVIQSNAANNLNQQFKLIAINKSSEIKAPASSLAFEAYPNPATSELNIQLHNFDENTRIEIFNSNGQLQLSRIATSSLENINIESLNQGMYFIRVCTEELVETQKIMIQ
ncbi:MAG: sulfatase-like hydrolase/transferase [Bacteroidales bacterium]|nr:sulfatase-like hydrolase/transferase [Bacteroidales bacterium]